MGPISDRGWCWDILMKCFGISNIFLRGGARTNRWLTFVKFWHNVICMICVLQVSGGPMTIGKNVKVRLYRGVASLEWSQLFPGARVWHIVSTRSDHFPILLELTSEENRKAKCIFRYEIMWERENSLHEEIVNAWESVGQTYSLGDIGRALDMVRGSLKKWTMDKFGSVTKEYWNTKRPCRCKSRRGTW
jgi:hypothetical protein